MTSSFEDTQYILKKYHLKANKKLGQNFLVNDEAISNIIDSSEINENDFVIEIGPGLGTLTSKLLEKAGKVIAIELDERMIDILTDRFKLYSNFVLLHEDILKVNLQELIRTEKDRLTSVKVVANLPYYITTPILMKLLEEKLPIESITVMVQKEVAERITATPGDKLSGAITYSVNYYADAEKVVFVDKSSFIPSPEVDSEVIKLTIRKEPKVVVQNEKLFFQVIRASFMQRRKTLWNGLTNAKLVQDKEKLREIWEKLELDPSVRGEKLTQEQFAELSTLIDQTISATSKI